MRSVTVHTKRFIPATGIPRQLDYTPGRWQDSIFTALFHQWATEANGDGETEVVAILELEDGTVEIEPARNIRFIDSNNSHPCQKAE